MAPANLHRLTSTRSRFEEELARYLDTLVERVGALHWERGENGQTSKVRVEDIALNLGPPLPIEGEDNVVVTGPAGSGKSFLLAKSAVDLAQQALNALVGRTSSPDQLCIPLHAELKTFAGFCRGRRFGEACGEFLRRKRALPSRLSAWIVDGILRGRHVVFLDGLDEVPPELRGYLLSTLGDVAAQRTPIRTAVSCRDRFYDSNQVPLPHRLVELPAPERQWADGFVGKWLGAAAGASLRTFLRNNRPFEAYTRTPLRLTCLCLAWDDLDGGEAVPRGIRDLILRHFLRRTEDPPLAVGNPSVDRLLGNVQKAASYLLGGKPNTNAFSRRQILDALQRAGCSTPSELLEKLLRCGLLLPRAGLGGETVHSFVHAELAERARRAVEEDAHERLATMDLPAALEWLLRELPREYRTEVPLLRALRQAGAMELPDANRRLMGVFSQYILHMAAAAGLPCDSVSIVTERVVNLDRLDRQNLFGFPRDFRSVALKALHPGLSPAERSQALIYCLWVVLRSVEASDSPFDSSLL